MVSIFEVIVDAALAEVRRHGVPEHVLAEARSAGLVAGTQIVPELVDRICFQFGQTHDTSPLWQHMKKDPGAFRQAVRHVLERHPRKPEQIPARGADPAKVSVRITDEVCAWPEAEVAVLARAGTDLVIETLSRLGYRVVQVHRGGRINNETLEATEG